MEEINQRLIFVTGKGGVGKTSVALSLCQRLQNEGKKVLYNCFDQLPDYTACEQLNLSFLELNAYDSAGAYIAKKLGSETVAKWVMKTPFFKSLFNMLPSFSMMIVLGHLIEHLEKDPLLHIVVDSPSSGHALTMLEASRNFSEMFGAGKLVDDIHRMHEYLFDQSFTKILIVTLPTEMALQEGMELKKNIEKLNFSKIEMVINDIYGLHPALKEHHEETPEFLIKKIAGEKEVLDKYHDGTFKLIAHFSASRNYQVAQQLNSDHD